MRIPRTLAALALLGSITVAVPASAAVSGSDATAPGRDKPSNHGFAVIGDVPYGAVQVAAFPSWVDRINAEPGLDLAFHVGDIKNGSSVCSDDYFSMIRAQLDRFAMPLLYTPGDNEWTDCHRPAAGAYDPLERLAAVRSTFFDRPGRTLGARPRHVGSQAAIGFPENQSTRLPGVEIATLHVVGSNNDRAPWTGRGLSAPTQAQLAEESERMRATIAHLHATFDRARRTHARAVALFQQADMFDPSYDPSWDVSAFVPLVRALTDEASHFDGEVYLFDGDSHVFNVDQPLAPGSRWLQVYGVEGSADNLTRVTVDGEDQNTDFLEVTVSRPGAPRVLTWRRVPYASTPAG